MKPCVATALSGGVDSMMAAHLLREKDATVFGVHFTHGFGAGPCPSEMERLGHRLGIKIYFVDFSEAFRKKVIDYFAESYASGKTPNPCLVCNPDIKFGLLFDVCKGFGATHLATGHYARVRRETDGGYHLYRGKDTQKDQSYFLSRLTQEQLSRALFPLGDLTKDTVKQLAGEKGLVPAARGESQDVCFIQGASYGEFLSSLPGFSPRTGSIVDRRGNILGSHRGLHLFTVGQRRGINCPAAEPYYVLSLEPDTGCLVVGKKAETYASSCMVKEIRWINGVPDGEFRGETRIRYRHRAAPSVVRPTGPDTAQVHFDSPQKAVTPGQGAVFYRGDEVLGGGWITKTPDEKGIRT